jgi:tellurite resistance protein TehA-like permease
MSQTSDPSDFRFLYRQGDGVVGPARWARASLPPVAIALALTAVALFIAPDKPRDLANEPFIDAGIVATHVYFLAYAFILILCAVAEYFVSAKRFTDRCKPAALAGLAPFALLLAGAANWYQPRSEGSMPEALTYVFDAIALGVVAWNVIELGFGASRRA